MEIKIGDIVHLNSDLKRTILMTVNSNGASSSYLSCVWFGGYELKTATFNKAALTKIDK